MPTGYTSDLYEGKDITFEDFILRCARNFGALITMRDASPDAEIPNEFKPDLKYVNESIEEYRNALNEALNWSEEEAQEAADKAVADSRARRVEYQEKAEALKSRYLDMLSEVYSWEPPTEDHVGLKKFMISQLEESIRFDCNMDGFPHPERKDGEEYRRERVEFNTRMLNNSVSRREEYIQRARERTAWVKALKESLR